VALEVTVDIGLTGQPASDWIATEANASYRLDSDDNAAFSSPTEVTTASLTTGVERYEVWDATGTSDSTWYRFRIEDNADSALSDWSVPFQVHEEQPIATLASVKLRLGSGASTTDDDVLMDIIDSVNHAIVNRIGYYPGPSSATSRDFDGKDAVADGKRLYVHPGIRSLTSLSIATSTGGSATAATLTDVALGPPAWRLRPGEPFHYLEFKDVTSGAHSIFAYGYANIETEGLYGWAEVPADLVHVATAMAIRRWKTRASGDVDTTGSDEFGQAIISDRLPAEWRRVIDRYRIDGWAY
jgi:hypothetical protein